MAEITLEAAPQRVRDIFNRGFAALERGNLDYAIDLLGTCLELEPRLLSARRYLRAAQVQKRRAGKGGVASSVTVAVRGLPLMLQVRMALRKNPLKALVLAERLMTMDPLRPAHVLLLADAAVAAELSEVAVQALQMALESLPEDAGILRHLGDLYAAMGQPTEARKIFEKLTELQPNNHDVIKAYKDAMARESMVRDGWGKAGEAGGSFRDAVRDSAASATLEHEAKAMRQDSDLDRLLTEMLGKVAAEPDNLNYYKALARLYVQKQDFEQALGALEVARQRRQGDPELDGSWSAVKVQEFEHRIAAAAAAGAEAEAVALGAEKRAFILKDLEDRVTRYPTDLRLRFDLGRAYFEEEEDRVTDAIRQLQAAQRSPKHRVLALYYLGLCFRRKGQLDLAMDQLRVASDELVGMDDIKKALLYAMGEILTELGRREEALELFKRIYQVDIGYRDIVERVEGRGPSPAA